MVLSFVKYLFLMQKVYAICKGTLSDCTAPDVSHAVLMVQRRASERVEQQSIVTTPSYVEGESDADKIICPVVATGVNQGILPISNGAIAFDDLSKYLHALGAGPLIDFSAGRDDMNPLMVFEMNGKPALEHALSTGIRDPQKNRERMDKLLSFADPNGIFTMKEFGDAFDWFENAENHHEEELPINSSLAMGGILAVFEHVFLPIFGRCGPKERLIGGGTLGTTTSHYPEHDYIGENKLDHPSAYECSPEGSIFMRADDIESIFWRNQFPDGFSLSVR